ncbi:hypothetical protein OFM04_31090, partial [Escherichia coli]|nr:hypothetical protein [Escherichia coli]
AMRRPQKLPNSVRYYVFGTQRWLSRRWPKRTWWRNQKVGEAEHLARLPFKHPYAWVRLTLAILAHTLQVWGVTG